MSATVGIILDRKGRDVVTIEAGATLAEATTRLAERGIGALVVTAEGQPVAGIISERDIVRCIASEGSGCLERPVREFMSTDVRTCTTEDNADELSSVMTERRFRHLPVVEDGELVGIVSIGDVVKSRIDDLEVEKDALEGYVTGSQY